MPHKHPALIRVGIVVAAVFAIADCTHVADVLTDAGTRLRRHGSQSSDTTQSSRGSTQAPAAGGATKADTDAMNAAFKAAQEECKASFAAPELDPIRHKIELYRASDNQEPLPFEIASNDNFPTADERPVIVNWGTLRDACLRRTFSVPLPPSASQVQTAMLKQVLAFAHQVADDETELIICLHQQKLTYGEFGRKRYEVVQAAAAFQLAIAQVSTANKDQQHTLEELLPAQQQFTETLDGFSKYVRAVKARKPRTVRMDGSVQTTR